MTDVQGTANRRRYIHRNGTEMREETESEIRDRDQSPWHHMLVLVVRYAASRILLQYRLQPNFQYLVRYDEAYFCNYMYAMDDC